MSRIQKRYWKWDNLLSPKLFNLNLSLDELLDKGLITHDQNLKEPQLYSFVENPFWKVEFIEGRISCISLRREYFPINGSNEIWDLNYDEFCNVLDDFLEPSEGLKSGDYLYVVFRGGFVSNVLLIRRY